MTVNRGRRFGWYCVIVGVLLFLSYCNPIPWQQINDLLQAPSQFVENTKHKFKRPKPKPAQPIEEDFIDWPLPNPQSFPDPMVGAEEFGDSLVDEEEIPADETPSFPPSTFDESHSSMPLVSLEDRMAAVERLLKSDGDDLLPPAGHNRKALHDLTLCIYDPQCSKTPQLIILVSNPFHKAILSPPHGNLKLSVLHALDSLNVTYVFSPKDVGWAQSVHEVFSDETRAVIFDPSDLRSCLDDTVGCVRSAENNAGIPAYKMFSWEDEASGTPPSPFGHAWTFTAEQDHRGSSFVGFAVPGTCRQSAPYVMPSERLDRVWVHAQVETQFWHTQNVWPAAYFEDAGKELDGKAEFVAALHPTDGRLKDYAMAADVHTVPDNLFELQVEHEDMLREIGRSRLLLGLWDPRSTYSVLEAMCLGVPFLNPVKQWDPNNPSDRSQWIAQNPELITVDPPYVYNVFEGDYAGFKDAISKAMDAPIPGFIPPHLTETALRLRLVNLLARDWKAEAQKVEGVGAGAGFLL
uniref:Alpha-1,6-mannosyl-glycoprotein 6-beta-N-acetylglucosaminyltransferase n=1 Tax=Mycena chlorophos TaxID=658473 RepID=A0ABQ0M649_MYCCL|nr:predicted protein [Mycena chlorophos]